MRTYDVRKVVEGTYEIRKVCIDCRVTQVFTVPAQGLWDYEHGKLIGQAMPTVAPELREMFLSGICPRCWNKLFADVDEDEPVGNHLQDGKCIHLGVFADNTHESQHCGSCNTDVPNDEL
jgi:hypothetical protein